MTDVYSNCPAFEDEKYLLRFVEEQDADDLLEVYSDKNALSFFNSDNYDGVLRLDVGSTYEKESILYHIMSLVVPPAFELFDCDEIITKVPNYAVERIKAVQRFGFTKSEGFLIGTHDGYAYNGYWKYRNKLHKSGGAFMDIVYRRLSDKELDTFIAMRINQLREEGAKEDMDLRPALKDYYQRHMEDETFISWIALDNEKIIGTSGISIVEKPPYFGCPSGKIALLSSMFTDKSYRRQGIAKKLLSLVVDEARKQGCGTVQITASDMGVLLYTDFGFVKNNNFMQYKL